MGKTRVTVTVDDTLVEAARKYAEKCGSLSAWVAKAMEERVRHEQRMAAMDDALAAYEAEFGPISDAEVEAQMERDRASAVRTGLRTTATNP